MYAQWWIDLVSSYAFGLVVCCCLVFPCILIKTTSNFEKFSKTTASAQTYDLVIFPPENCWRSHDEEESCCSVIILGNLTLHFGLFLPVSFLLVFTSGCSDVGLFSSCVEEQGCLCLLDWLWDCEKLRDFPEPIFTAVCVCGRNRNGTWGKKRGKWNTEDRTIQDVKES